MFAALPVFTTGDVVSWYKLPFGVVSESWNFVEESSTTHDTKSKLVSTHGHCLFYSTFTLLFIDLFPPDTIVNQADQLVSFVRHHLAIVNV